MLLTQLEESSVDELIELTKESNIEQLEIKLLEIKNVVSMLLNKSKLLTEKSKLKVIIKARLNLEEIKKKVISLHNMLQVNPNSKTVASEVFTLVKDIKDFRQNNITIIKEINKAVANSNINS
ncbi:hypothetical protein K9M79_05965 [Candidatus Woesearchaeota archaeon]|nr:hypothetical protein [Candidatus Woesearchaeota archaeon]